MPNHSIQLEELDIFFQDAWITEILDVVKSGKEAVVYCCRAHPNTGAELVAAKVYKAQERRAFRNDAVYQEGRVILDTRLRRAVAKKTQAGKSCQSFLWVEHEYEVLQMLRAAGADVPKPIVRASGAIIMEYVGDYESAAAPLRNVTLHPDEAERLFDTLMRNVELWLSYNCVHGDLSAFNVLYWQGGVKVIDFPQAVDPRFNRNAFDLLLRDIENICTYFGRYGIRADPLRIAGSLWDRFTYGDL